MVIPLNPHPMKNERSLTGPMYLFPGEKGEAYTLMTATDQNFAGDLVRNLVGAAPLVQYLLYNPMASEPTYSFQAPKSDHFQIYPAVSPEILHYTVWRTWLFIAYSDERWLCYQVSLPHLYIYPLWVGRLYFLNLGVKGLALMRQQWNSGNPDKWSV